MNHRGIPNQFETRLRETESPGSNRARKAPPSAAKLAVERQSLALAPLSISAEIFSGHTQDVENLEVYGGERAGWAQARKRPATFACRSETNRIQTASSGKWGEVPIFNISRIEMTNV